MTERTEANTCSPENIKKAYDEIFAKTRRSLASGPSFLACSDERTADAILEAMNMGAPKSSCCPDCDEFEAETAAELERDRSRKSEREDRLREALAAYAHEAWAGWMRNQAALQLQMERKGTTVITWAAAEDYDRWARQMRTPYADLPEAEKASDRAQADKILEILRGEGR